MSNAIILHGLYTEKEYYDTTEPSASNNHWFPWLQRQLQLNGIKADTPEIPRPFDFDYSTWVTEVERFDIRPETILIGHSMGGGFWLRYLSEHSDLHVAQVVLVAPWMNVKHEEDTTFFDFTLRPEVVSQAKHFMVFTSDNDMDDVQNSVAFIHERLLAAEFHTFHNYGHFCRSDMKTDNFPELLAVVLARISSAS